MRKILKSEFDAANNKYQPSGWIKFAYKYFSKQTEKKDMSLRNHVTFGLLSLFFLGFFGTVLKASVVYIGIVTIAYSIILSILVLYLLSAVLFNNRRLKKVMKELGITKTEYDQLIWKYYKE